MDAKMKWIILFFAAATILLALWFFLRREPIRWIVYYGSQISSRFLMNVDLAILEPDSISPNAFGRSSTLFFGYLSVGEVNTGRDYWPEIMGKKFVVEENPNWPGAWRVDIRSAEWQQLLLEKVIPNIVQKGYRGLFLDTVDTAAYLEEKDPKQFSGSKEAMVRFIQTIQKKHPSLLILPNNALELLPDYGNEIFGVVVEDLYTRCDPAARICGRTPEKDSLYKEERLDVFMKRFKKPVFNILYDYSGDKKSIRYGVKRSEKKGYHWYLTSPDLAELGTIGK